MLVSRFKNTKSFEYEVKGSTLVEVTILSGNKIVIPEGISNFDSEIAVKSDDIVDEIIFPNTVTTFPINFFRNNKCLSRVKKIFLGGIIELPDNAFQDFFFLKTIKSKNTLKLGNYSLLHCFNLVECDCNRMELKEAFGDTDNFDYALITGKRFTKRKRISKYKPKSMEDLGFMDFGKRYISEFTLANCECLDSDLEIYNRINTIRSNKDLGYDKTFNEKLFHCQDAYNLFWNMKDIFRIHDDYFYFNNRYRFCPLLTLEGIDFVALREWLDSWDEKVFDCKENHLLKEFRDQLNELESMEKIIHELDALCDKLYNSKKDEQPKIGLEIKNKLPEYINKGKNLAIFFSKEGLERMIEFCSQTIEREDNIYFGDLSDSMLIDLMPVADAIARAYGLPSFEEAYNMMFQNQVYYKFLCGADGDMSKAIIEIENYFPNEFDQIQINHNTGILDLFLYRFNYQNERIYKYIDMGKEKSSKNDNCRYQWYKHSLKVMTSEELISIRDELRNVEQKHKILDEFELEDKTLGSIFYYDIMTSIKNHDYKTFMYYYNIAKTKKNNNEKEKINFSFEPYAKLIFPNGKEELIDITKKSNFNKITLVKVLKNEE